LNSRERALVLCGPTASGKSAIALGIAKLLDGEIINADSRQIYRGLSIGTATPPPESFRQVPHHLYGFLSPSQRYSAAQFATQARQLVRDIAARGKLPIVAGGTGFYIEALIGSMTLDRPPPDDPIRERLRDELKIHGSDVLWQWLQARQPAIASGVRPTDSYRILRGLERTLAIPPASIIAETYQKLDGIVVRLTVPKAELRTRIERRVHDMFQRGLVQEAVAVRDVWPHATALSGLGYAESLALWDGYATQREAVARAITRTEQYAKRQETWFRHMSDAVPIEATNENDAIKCIVALARERLTLA
jgi:tRNA dimethylallyltransferase